MNRKSWPGVRSSVSAGGLLLALVLSTTTGNRTAGAHGPLPAASDPPFYLVSFDENGAFIYPEQVERAVKQGHDKGANQVFLFSHGWNNSQADALASYTAMTQLMKDLADKHHLRPDGFSPLLIGIRWPSKAWVPEPQPESPVLAPTLLAAIYENLSPRHAPDTYSRDVLRLQDLLSRVPKDADEKDRTFREVFTLLSRYGLNEERVGGTDPVSEGVFSRDESTPVPEGVLTRMKEKLQSSSTELFRLFTYWQMKQRAGQVGETGVHALLGRLQKEFPDAAIHLIGHSFGCKVVLSAVRGSLQAPLLRPVDTVVLIQGAISYQSFIETVPATSQPGGYRMLLGGGYIRGPIVATFSSHDKALGEAYPLASSLRNQTGSQEAVFDRFAALGAKGFDQVTPGLMKEEGTGYGFGKGLQSVDCSGGIPGHSEIQSPRVGWLIWCAVLRK
jgi:hypothetical protein